jgi:hypothetical protein
MFREDVEVEVTAEQLLQFDRSHPVAVSL